MCGRYTLTNPSGEVVLELEVERLPLFEARYNIAPSMDVPVLGQRPDGSRLVAMLEWGLDVGKRRLSQARSETVHVRPAFAEAFRSRRCLMLADGFYEWQALEEGEAKQPYWLRLASGAVFGFAALFEGSAKGGFRCCLLTKSASGELEQIHERMPVVLDREQQIAWLDPATDASTLLEIARSGRPAADFVFHPVSRRVGNVRNDDAELIAPLAG